MATVKIVILKHQKREDDTWNVKIRIIHERQSSYIATAHYWRVYAKTREFHCLRIGFYQSVGVQQGV